MVESKHGGQATSALAAFVEGWVFNNRARLLLVFAGLAGLVSFAVGTGFLAGQYDGARCDAGKRAFYLLGAFVYLGVIALWLLRARSFREDLHSPEGLSDCIEYGELYAKYEQFLGRRVFIGV